MIAVLQRVREASVTVGAECVGKIGHGLAVLVGVAKGDAPADVSYMVEKIATLRIFGDEQGKMNRSLEDVGGAVLVVSQFTLVADHSRGRRPSFEHAAPPEAARELYERVAAGLRDRGLTVETGRFGAMMLVGLQNDGPVTLLLDSKAENRNKEAT